MKQRVQLNGRFGRDPQDVFVDSNYRIYVPEVGGEIGSPNNYGCDKTRMIVSGVAEAPDGWVVVAEVKWLSQLRNGGTESERERVERKANSKLDDGVFCTFVISHEKNRAVNIFYGTEEAANSDFIERQQLEFAGAAPATAEATAAPVNEIVTEAVSVAFAETATEAVGQSEAATVAPEPVELATPQDHQVFEVDEKSGQLSMF